MAKLTAKREAFIQGLLKGESQRQAYKHAYNAENMTDKCIDEAACRLLASSKVNARYYSLMTKLQDKAEEQGLLEATDVLKKIVDLIERNEGEDDRAALEGLKTYGKHLKMFTDRVEVAVTEMPEIVLKKHK